MSTVLEAPRLRREAIVLAVALAALAVGGCATARVSDFENPTDPAYRVAMVQFAQETNSFSPVPTTYGDFEAAGIHRGEAVLDYARSGENALSGFVSAISQNTSVEIVPILKATSTSGGPVERSVYEGFRDEIVAAVAKAAPLDGIYLALHGAMGVEGMRDPEGDLLRALRRVVGPELPIGVSHDLHANVTEERVRQASYIVGYHTNPHRDFFETGYKSGEILLGTVLGELNPVMEVRKMRLLKGGGMNIDFLSPMRKIFRRMDRMEREDDVLAVSNFMVHIWLDDPELGWTTIAVTDGDRDLAGELAEELADADWEVRDVPHPEGYTAEEAVEMVRKSRLARAFGTTVLCDVADAVGAGAPGENAWILKAFLENAPDLRTYIPIRDSDAARTAFAAGAGVGVTLEVGGETETRYNTTVTYSGVVERIYDTTRYGKVAVVSHDGIRLIVTERPATARSPQFFKEFGFRVTRADAVVVKNLFPFRYTYLLQNRKTLNVMTPGTTSVDVFELEYRRIPRPIYPLDDIDSWKP